MNMADRRASNKYGVSGVSIMDLGFITNFERRCYSKVRRSSITNLNYVAVYSVAILLARHCTNLYGKW